MNARKSRVLALGSGGHVYVPPLGDVAVLPHPTYDLRQRIAFRHDSVFDDSSMEEGPRVLIYHSENYTFSLIDARHRGGGGQHDVMHPMCFNIVLFRRQITLTPRQTLVPATFQPKTDIQRGVRLGWGANPHICRTTTTRHIARAWHCRDMRSMVDDQSTRKREHPPPPPTPLMQQ